MRFSMLGWLLAAIVTVLTGAASYAAGKQPNIVFILTDNLGYGEIGTPSRASLMTGRWAIRSGCHSVPFGGVADGLTQWEVTIGEALSDAGYATGYYGKWHLGSHDGRLPIDQGFDEWFGIPRTTDEALWPSSPGWKPDIMPPEHTMEGKEGEKSRELKVYDVEQRRLIDAEITWRSVEFIERQGNTRKPFSSTSRSRSRTCPRCRIPHSPAQRATAIGPTC